MCSCERESDIVVECASCASGWVTSIACRTGVYISSNTIMLIVNLRLIVMSVAVDTAIQGKIVCCCVTLGTKCPGTLVPSRIYWEILSIMVKGGWYPCRGAVTGLAVGAELCCSVIRIIGVIIIRLMASNTGIGSCCIISFMTLIASYGCMESGQWIIGVVNCKSSRLPSGICCMAICTGRGNICRLMWRIRAGIVVGLVTPHTSILSCCIIPVMTGVAIDSGMSACQCVVSIMYGKRGWFPSRNCSVAIGTGFWNISSLVRRVCAGIVIGEVAGNAIPRQTRKSAICMAPGAVEVCMPLGEREE